MASGVKEETLAEETQKEKDAALTLSAKLGEGRITYEKENLLTVRNKRDFIILCKDIKDNKFEGVSIDGSSKVIKLDSGTFFRYRITLDGGKFTLLGKVSENPVEVKIIDPKESEEPQTVKDIEDKFEDELNKYRSKVKMGLQRVFFREYGVDKNAVDFILSAECKKQQLFLRLSVIYNKEEDIAPQGVDALDVESVNASYEEGLTEVAKRTFGGGRKFMDKDIDKYEFTAARGIKSLKVILKASREDKEKYKDWEGATFDLEF